MLEKQAVISLVSTKRKFSSIYVCNISVSFHGDVYHVEIKDLQHVHMNLSFNLHMFYLELACIHMLTILQFTKSNYLLSYMTVKVILSAHFTKSLKTGNSLYCIHI